MQSLLGTFEVLALAAYAYEPGLASRVEGQSA